MTREPSKYVRIELTAAEYDALRAVADECGLRVEDASREVLLAWIQRQRCPDPSDPAFTVLEALDTDVASAAATTDAREEDDLVEEWSGEDV